MQNTKLTGFVRGMAYPVVCAILSYIIANLGESGLVTGASATIITGILAVIEHAIEANTGRALFGAIKTS